MALRKTSGSSLLDLIIGISIVGLVIVYSIKRVENRVCIAEKEVKAIVSVDKYETRVLYTDGTQQTVSTVSGVKVNDRKCLAYE